MIRTLAFWAFGFNKEQAEAHRKIRELQAQVTQLQILTDDLKAQVTSDVITLANREQLHKETLRQAQAYRFHLAHICDHITDLAKTWPGPMAETMRKVTIIRAAVLPSNEKDRSGA